MAVDFAGNVFIADNNGIKEWNAATATLSPIASGAFTDVATDVTGNAYFTDANNAIVEMDANAIDRQSGHIGALVSARGRGGRPGQRLHRRYRQISRSKNGAPCRRIVTLVNTGLASPNDVAVETRATFTSAMAAVTTRSSFGTPRRRPSHTFSLTATPNSLAINGSGNVYITKPAGTVKDLPQAFMPTDHDQQDAAIRGDA